MYGDGIMEFYDMMNRVGNRKKEIQIIWDERDDYPVDNKHETLITWLPKEMAEDVISLVDT